MVILLWEMAVILGVIKSEVGIALEEIFLSLTLASRLAVMDSTLGNSLVMMGTV